MHQYFSKSLAKSGSDLSEALRPHPEQSDIQASDTDFYKSRVGHNCSLDPSQTIQMFSDIPYVSDVFM